MSDYYLKRIYDSVLTSKHAKSNYRTLSESYSLIYEQENVDNQTDQPPTDNQEVNAAVKSPFNFIEVSEQKWTDIQRDLYQKTINLNGVGPGEYAVASVVSGFTDVEKCKALVSGGSVSYDVSYPSKDDAQQKFEVKMFQDNKDVMIAKHGTKAANKIQEDTKKILNIILEQYEKLEEDGKVVINTLILENINVEVGAELSDKERKDMQLLKKMKKELETLTGDEAAKLNDLETRNKIEPLRRKRAKELQNFKESNIWTVENWCKSIISDIGELPFNTILFKGELPKGYDYMKTQRALVEPRDDINKMYVLFSVEEFINIVNSIEQSEDVKLIPEPTRERRAGLEKTFKQYYSDEKTNTELDNKLDAEVINVDKKLSSLKINVLKTGYEDFNTFVRDLKNANLTEKLKTLKAYIEANETVKGLFPEDLTGLFVVNPISYHYFPREKIPEKIKITTITGGGIKIGFKK